jgi:hypothetical protein
MEEEKEKERSAVAGWFGRDQQAFSVNNQLITILGFVRHVVSSVTTQLRHCSVKAATDNV